MKTRGHARAALLAITLGVAVAGACGTTYQPRASGRVSLVIHHGSARYVKNGVETAVGAFGGGLRPLVADTPAAAAEAQTAHTELMIGTPAYLTGVTAIVIGLVVLSGPAGWIVIGAGAAVGGTGVGLMGAGFTHTVDAMNIHNDAMVPGAATTTTTTATPVARPRAPATAATRP